MRWIPVILLVVASSNANAVIVDRAAIAVANKVITASDIDRSIRLASFQSRVTPDFSPASRKAAASRLIDQKVVEREMELGHYPRLPDTRGNELVLEFARSNYGGDVSAVKDALTRYSLSTVDLEEELLIQANLLTFLNLRFPAGIARPEADADLNNWLADQRKRTKIDYIDPELKPGPELKP